MSVFCVVFSRRIAGLTEKKAKAILTWREENGPFINREQLKEVKGIGLKTYEQCVGFVRISNPAATASFKEKTEGNTKEEAIEIGSDDEQPTVARGKKRNAEGTKKEGMKKKMKTEQKAAGNPLDMTWIHPESYEVAHRFVTNQLVYIT